MAETPHAEANGAVHAQGTTVQWIVQGNGIWATNAEPTVALDEQMINNMFHQPAGVFIPEGGTVEDIEPLEIDID